ncbi:MAG: NUDIX hydrolase [Anaerolineales bacterium]|nr:NUDIX hydrolase [Anaerolineales bacterium]
MAYSVIQSEECFQGRSFRVRVDEVRRPDGAKMVVEVVDHPQAIALVPVDQEGNVWFVRQYRHPCGKTMLELPAGTIEPGEDPAACAVRECREEIGMAPGRIERLGGFYIAPGYSTEYIHLYLAGALTPAPLAPDADEDLHVERVPLLELAGLVESGLLEDAKSLAGLLLARRFLIPS